MNWVVLKFGGTSVASRERWQTIREVASARAEEGYRVVVVCSAVSGISNQLVSVIDCIQQGNDWRPLFEAIRARHVRHADELTVDWEAHGEPWMQDLERLLLGASLIGEVSPRLHARILSCGELVSTALGAAFLEAQCAHTTQWVDARDCLQTVERPGASSASRFLMATCAGTRDEQLEEKLAATGACVLVTQGFIARDSGGLTALLGRGGSDTSAAYFAAALDAAICEIWTDVPGMFSANPRQVPTARLLTRLDYAEAQEIASTGAKVLHPRAIGPCWNANIPMRIKCTPHPDMPGTSIEREGVAGSEVKAISSRSDILLIAMETLGMWQQVGFLAEAFGCFASHGLSIDLISTSESNVTVSLDPTSNALDPAVIERLLADLSQWCSARVIGPCAAVSLVGRNIRALLHRLGPALEVFEEQEVHLVSQASSDLNLTFVVGEAAAARLVTKLHGMLFPAARKGGCLGPSWQQLFEDGPRESTTSTRWWETRRNDLLELAQRVSPAYVYDLSVVREAARRLTGLGAVSRVYYAMKANPNPAVLRAVADEGLGIECVSPGEVAHCREVLPDLAVDRILFTPNFAGPSEYSDALAMGIHVTLDNLHPLVAWPELFRGRPILLRIDPGTGRGHHDHVRTAGSRSKFGISLDRFDELLRAVEASGAVVVGLHAHAGSGILQPGNWHEIAVLLTRVADHFPSVRYLDLGGGLGVVEKPGQAPLDLAAVDRALAEVHAARPDLEIWMEPGRYLVASAGVLLGRVTQLKQKSDVRYVGIDVGMNSLIRPALYGAWHEIVNLTRLGEPASETVHVVGPICESGDVLGRNRRLPPTEEGDVLLIGTAGAYGRAMSSTYNLRAPAAEVVLPD